MNPKLQPNEIVRIAQQDVLWRLLFFDHKKRVWSLVPIEPRTKHPWNTAPSKATQDRMQRDVISDLSTQTRDRWTQD